jgi:hypothetical protein
VSEYVVLLLGDAERERWWSTVSEQERKDMFAEHDRFGRELAARGHTIKGGAELHASAEARIVHPGGTVVTEGPYAETSELVGGYYVVDSDDLDDLVECCKILAATGEAVEVRRTVDHSADG